MSSNRKLLLYFVLPTLAPLIFPPDWITGLLFPGGYVSPAGVIGLLLVIALFIGLGFMLMGGSSSALTLAIFLQGLNVIVRLMMLFPRVYSQGGYNIPYIVTTILSISLSMYLLLRLDRVDIRATMVK
jgi:hypothetical protein